MSDENDESVMDADQAQQMMDDAELRRLVEALLFAATEPVPMAGLLERLPKGTDLGAILEDLQKLYAGRGISLERHGDAWAFRTAADLAPVLTKQVDQPKKLTRATLETLAIIAYHQPVTRGEIETIRGVAVSRGSLDTLLEQGWIKPGRRRETPGRPVTWVTTPAFLDHFDLNNINDLPGIDELKAAGLLDARPAVAALADRWPDQLALEDQQAHDTDDDENELDIALSVDDLSDVDDLEDVAAEEIV